MGPPKHEPVADMIRAIGITRAEAASFLLPYGITSASLDHMCSGKTKADPKVLEVLAKLWLGIDRELPLDGFPGSMSRRRDNIAILRDLALEFSEDDLAAEMPRIDTNSR